LTLIGGHIIAGVDEAGRGALFGPVFAAAVAFKRRNIPMDVKDSKMLTPQKREILYSEILEKAEDISICFASNFQIDKLNIHKAGINIMRQAVLNLGNKISLVFVDGFEINNLPLNQVAVKKGDQKIPVISAASIIAKVARDKLMILFSQLFPEYNLEKHKGYGTREHIEIIKKRGETIFHRNSFKIKSLN